MALGRCRVIAHTPAMKVPSKRKFAYSYKRKYRTLTANCAVTRDSAVCCRRIYSLLAALQERVELRRHFAAQIAAQMTVRAVGVHHVAICHNTGGGGGGGGRKVSNHISHALPNAKQQKHCCAANAHSLTRPLLVLVVVLVGEEPRLQRNRKRKNTQASVDFSLIGVNNMQQIGIIDWFRPCERDDHNDDGLLSIRFRPPQTNA